MISEVKKILVVDDDTFFLQGFEKALRTGATDVKAVETGASALEEVASASYQLCFLDLCLSDADGTEVLKKMKEISPKTRVVVMTAGIVTPGMQKDIEKNAYMFITKPFDLLQVKMLARRIIEETA